MALGTTSATWESRGPHGSEGLGADRGGAEGGCIRAEEQKNIECVCSMRNEGRLERTAEVYSFYIAPTERVVCDKVVCEWKAPWPTVCCRVLYRHRQPYRGVGRLFVK